MDKKNINYDIGIQFIIKSIVVFFFIANGSFVNAQSLGNTTRNGNGAITKSVADSKKILWGALLAPNGKQYFFTQNRYFRLSKKNGLEKIANIKENWLKIPDKIDGVFVHPENKKAYFFKGNKYNRWDFNKGIDNNELAISRFWDGVPNNIDAVTNHTNGKTYFFKGDKYYRYNHKLKKVDKISLIRSNWKGVPDNVSAAFLHENGKVYFFKDKKIESRIAAIPSYRRVEYYRFDIKLNKVDKIGYIGVDGWKDLDFKKSNFTKKVENMTAISKKNLRLKITLTRIKSVQAKDSDNIADFYFYQEAYYRTIGRNPGLPYKKIIRVGSNLVHRLIDTNKSGRKDIIKGLIHVREGNEKHYINNSIFYEIMPNYVNDKNAKFELITYLQEISHAGFLSADAPPYVIADRTSVKVNIHSVIDFLKNPDSSTYWSGHFSGGGTYKNGGFGDGMWFEKGTDNSLLAHLEFGNNRNPTYVRLYYRFELVR